MEPLGVWLDQVDAAQWRTRYIAAASLTCIIWDHALTLNDEVVYIWGRPHWDSSVYLFFLGRYGNAAVIFLLTLFGDILAATIEHPTPCRAFLISTNLFLIAAITIGNVSMTLRMFSLWDVQRSFKGKLVLWSGFAFTSAGMTASFVACAKEIFEYGYQQRSIYSFCVLREKPKAFVGVWISMLFFDVFTILSAAGSALDRPYRQTAEIMSRLQQDGILILVALAVLRLINLILSVVVSPYDILTMTTVVCAMVTIAMSRLTLRVEEVRSQGSDYIQGPGGAYVLTRKNSQDSTPGGNPDSVSVLAPEYAE